MPTARCPRVWEVEAARDRRVDGSGLAEHFEHCEECRAESVALASLQRRLVAMPVPTMADGALARIGASVLDRGSNDAGPTWLRRSMVLAAAILVLVGGWRLVRKEAPRTTVVATDEGGARWSARHDGGLEHVDLLDGSLRLRVHRPAGGERVIVWTPDGEIEDIGTTFQVTVVAGRTESVAVAEGRVLVRIGAKPSVVVSAGERWERQPVQAALIPSAPGTESALLSGAPASVPPASSGVPSGPTPSVSNVVPSAPNLTPSAARATRPQPSVGAAAPETSAEDAAYILIVRLQREGREAEAKSAARAYVRRFPNGFRRVEMEALSRP